MCRCLPLWMPAFAGMTETGRDSATLPGFGPAFGKSQCAGAEGAAFALARPGPALGFDAVSREACAQGRHQQCAHAVRSSRLGIGLGVDQERFADLDAGRLRRTFDMLRAAARKKDHLLSRIGLLLDHVHWTIGCNIDESPLEVALSYLNNLAFAQEMRPVFQFGFYAGTFGPYDMNAVRRNL